MKMFKILLIKYLLEKNLLGSGLKTGDYMNSLLLIWKNLIKHYNAQLGV